MAWDGLGSIFKQKDKQGSNEARDTVAPQAAAGGYGGGNSAPVTQPYAGFGGNAGSAAGPVSSKFVNFGTLYGLNEDKAKGMAKGVYDSAAAAADKAKGQLQGARETFNQNLQQGTAKGVVGGPHGTRIDNYNPPQPYKKPEYHQSRKGEEVATSGAGPGSFLRGANYDANGNAIDETQPTTGRLTQTLESSVEPGPAINPAQYSGAGGTLTGGASRYSSLYGPVSSLGSVGGVAAETPDKEALKDYHATVDLLGAKSGAGQGYTGPGSLKESMGEQAYADLQKALGNAETGAQNLTTEGGIQNALGYEPGVSTGNSAMDTGLTETAGRAQFKRLADQTKGLGTLLPQAQADSERAAAGAGIQSADAAKQWQDLLTQYEADQKANADAENAPPGSQKPKKYGHYKHAYAEGTNGSALLNESGFSAAELEDAWGDFTQAEREYLSRGHNVFENLTGYGFSGDEATLKANILAKLANRRLGKA